MLVSAPARPVGLLFADLAMVLLGAPAPPLGVVALLLLRGFLLAVVVSAWVSIMATLCSLLSLFNLSLVRLF